MDSSRIEQIVGDLARIAEERMSRRKLTQLNEEIDNLFSRNWHSLYPTESLLVWPDAATIDVAMTVGRGAVDRHWDFYIGEQLGLPDLNIHFEMALITLRWACVQDREQVAKCFAAIGEQGFHVGVAHGDLYSKFKQQYNRDVPLTPPLNQQEMAAVMGITPGAFRSQFRAKKWRTKDPPSIGHARKWWNVDRQIHQDALRAIRNKFPEKIWLGNRVEE